MPELIDKQASMKAICDGCFKSRAVDIELKCRGTCNVIDILQQQPTIEAEPVRHGRWIEETEPDENGNVTAMCNQCYHTDEHCKNIKPPYCWYCGARMDATDTNDGGKGGTDNAGK